MSERKPCIRCERGIDAWSRICPFCNWDQNNPDPPAMQPTAAAAQYKPPEERSWKKRVLMAVGGIVLLIASFAVGAIINSDGAPDDAPETLEEQAAEQNADSPVPVTAKRANTELIPANEPIAAPITSAPSVAVDSAGNPSAYQRDDATAVSSVEYDQLAKRAQAEKKKMATLVDPRTLSGPAYAQQGTPAPRRPRTIAAQAQPQTAAGQPAMPPMASSAPPQAQPPETPRAARTRPVPEHQPIPNIRVDRTMSIRLDLTVGADGRVKEVGVSNPIPGQTARIIATVQSWRFKPATENGVPVAAPFSVELSFRGND